MAAGKGSSFLLKDNSTGTPATIGGLRSTSMTINGEMVDITDKDSIDIYFNDYMTMIEEEVEAAYISDLRVNANIDFNEKLFSNSN